MPSQTKITILCENRTCVTQDVMGEHGFCALVEKNEEKHLLDTGQGLCLIANAHAMGITLDDLTKIALSHGHFDHTGGLTRLPKQKTRLDIYAHPQVFGKKYKGKKSDSGDSYRYIGIPANKETIESGLNAHFILTKTFTQLSDGIFFSGEVPRVTDFETADTRLLLKDDTGYHPDPLIDDASLLIETSAGPVILSGCAHSGIVNTMEHFSSLTGHRSFHAVIGGTHLGFLNSPDQLKKTMDAFDRFDVRVIAVSHCTGNEAAAACYSRFKERFAFANAGWSVSFP